MKYDWRKHGWYASDIALGCVLLVIAVAVLGWNVYGHFFGMRRGHSVATCWENLIRINGAKEQWALDHAQPAGSRPTADDLAPSDGSGYMKNFPRCFAGEYEIGPIGEPPRCDSGKPGHTFEAVLQREAERDAEVERRQKPIGRISSGSRRRIDHDA